MGSEVKGAEGGGDKLSLGENLQLNMDDAAKVRANFEAAARVKAMASDETLKFNSEEGAIMNNNNTTKIPIPNTTGYRDMHRPGSPSRDDDDDDDDDDYKAMFSKLPSPCRPDSPVLPPIDYGADRIQNDLLDEICSDIGIKQSKKKHDDMDFDFLDFDVNQPGDPNTRNQFDPDGSLDQVIQFGQSQEGQENHPPVGSSYPSTSVPYAQPRPPSRNAVPQSPSRMQQRHGSQNSDHVSGSGPSDHLQRMAQLNASIAGSPAKSSMNYAGQMPGQSQRVKMEAPGSPKPSMVGPGGGMVPSSPSVRQRTSSVTGQYPQAAGGHAQGVKGEPGNMPYPARPPSLHGQPGRGLESPFDHGYYSVGSNAGSGSHDSVENSIPRLTPPPDEQTANDKVLQYLGQQNAQNRMSMQGQGISGHPGMQPRPGMQGSMGPRMPSSSAMSHFNAQMPPQQQVTQRHAPDQMFNYRPPQSQMQSSNMRGMAPHHTGPGPGPGGVNFGGRTPQGGFHPQGSQPQGFNFEHPMSQRYPSPYSNHPNYNQTPMGGTKGYNFQGQGHPGMTPGGPYPNFSSTQSSPDGYERSSMSRAKKQRLDSNAYHGKPQGLQYEPPTTLSQPLVDMKGANAFNPRLPGSGQVPGCPPHGQQMYPGQGPMRGPSYPPFNPSQGGHQQQSQYQIRHQSNFGTPSNQMNQHMPMGNQGPGVPPGAPHPQGGATMNTTQVSTNGSYGNKTGLSISQSYASLQAQLPPFQPGTQDFVQHLVTDRSSAFRSHPLFPLLRDLVIADMNFHSPTFPFQLISNLPADFNKLLQNYMQRNPASANHRMNEAVDNVIMDALRYAHKAFIEKITQRKQQHGGQGQKSFNAIEEFCERFDKAVKNTLAQNQDNSSGQQTMPQNTGMTPGTSNRLTHCGPSQQGLDGASNSMGNFGGMLGNTGPPQENLVNMQNPSNMSQNGMYQSQNPNMPARPSSTNSANGIQWNGIPVPNAGSMTNCPQGGMMQNQQNCGSMPNLNQASVDQSIDLLADIMGGSTPNQTKPLPQQNTNCNNANGGAFGAIMSEQLSSSMPGGLNTIDCNGVYSNPATSSGACGAGVPSSVPRQMSVPGATNNLHDSGRHASLPNVADPPPTPPPDHLLQHTDQNKHHMMNMFSTINHNNSTSMPNLVQQVNYPRYLSNNTPSPLNDSLHSTVDADSLYGDHMTDMRPSPRKGEGQKKQVLPKEAVAIMLEWLKEHQDKPYPNDDEKDMLIRRTKLTMSQINYWFTNARRRILPKWTLQRLLEEQSASGKMNPITIKQCQQLLGTKSIKSIKEALQKDINLFAESTPSPGSDA